MSGFRSGGQGESWLIRRSELLCGVLLTVLILGLQGYRFTQAGGHWRDEATTLESANLASISDVWSAQVYNRPPILAYAVVRWWARIGPDGSGDANSQLLGAVTGAGIVVALWAAGWMAGSQAPILALALFGLNGGVLQWGGSLRGYGLGALLILVAAGLIWKVTESATPGRVTAAVVVSVLSVQCVFQNAALLLAVCVAGCLVCARKRNWRSVGVVLGIGAVAAFTLIPYLGIISEYLDHNLVARRSHSFTEVIHSIAWAMNGGTDISLFIWMVCGVTAMVGVTVPFSYARAGPEGESVRDRALYCAGVMVLGTVSFLIVLQESGSAHPPVARASSDGAGGAFDRHPYPAGDRHGAGQDGPCCLLHPAGGPAVPRGPSSGGDAVHEHRRHRRDGGGAGAAGRLCGGQSLVYRHQLSALLQGESAVDDRASHSGSEADPVRPTERTDGAGESFAACL